MKTLGLIGGITWLSTVEYYRAINEQVNARLGGHHSAKIILYSVDFAEFQPPPPDDDAGWADIARRFGDAEATAAAVAARGLDRVALLGTRPTMEASFYPEILGARRVETMVPDPDDRAWIHASTSPSSPRASSPTRRARVTSRSSSASWPAARRA